MASLPVIPEAIPLATTEHPKSEAVRIVFLSGEKLLQLEVQRTGTLRGVQKRLCKEFCQHFPLMSAKLLNSKQQEFEEFMDMVADGWSRVHAGS